MAHSGRSAAKGDKTQVTAEKRKPGRPTKRTPGVEKVILDGIRFGLSIRRASHLASIAPSTTELWMSEDPEFMNAVQKAHADREHDWLACVRTAAEKGFWQAAMTLLERTNPADFGRKDRSQVELTGKDGGPVAVALEHLVTLAPAELAQRVQEAAARVGARKPE